MGLGSKRRFVPRAVQVARCGLIAAARDAIFFRPSDAVFRRAAWTVSRRAAKPVPSQVSRRKDQNSMARQFIYHMRGLTKTYPGGKKVLENINLSFYPDAKIGILGVNGSGKSTLMRIMAGIDTRIMGEGVLR